MRARTIILALVMVLALSGAGGAQPPHEPIAWRSLKPGMDFALVEATRYVHLGSSRVGVARLDPDRVRFRVFHFRDLAEGRPLTVEQWQKRTGALITVNPGQFDKRGTHLGLLIRDGTNIGTGLLSVWKGIFAAEPRNPSLPKAVLIDLAHAPFDPATNLYTQAVQSFMLLDRKGRKRVRRSDWKANRTILAMDQAGRVLLICTEGAFTLWEFADWLKESELGVVQAMSLDGGYKAEMAVAADDFEYVTYGQWETNDYGNLSLPGFKATLPAEVGVFQRGGKRMFRDRIRYAPLRDKITDPATAAGLIKDGMNLYVSGFSPAGYPKMIPRELAKRAESGEKLRLNLYAGASTGDDLDGVLARAGVVKSRQPYMGDRIMRAKINAGEIAYKDEHLSQFAGVVRSGQLGPVHVVVAEALGITDKGHLIPTMSVGNTPTFIMKAEKVIIEMTEAFPLEMAGIHDIFIPEDPPYRMPIPIYRAADRIGKPFIELDPHKVAGIVFSSARDTCPIFPEPDEVALLIAEQILDFVLHEIKMERIPPGLPWQSGVGDVANAVLAGFLEDDQFNDLEIYSEVLQDSVLDLIDLGKVRAASGSALTLSTRGQDRFIKELYRYKDKIVLRPVEISNSPEVIRRLGVVAINTALEVDIYGQVNSTHVMGSQIINGIGGSGDFERNASISFMVTPSTGRKGAVSRIVPMVTHVDHSEHSVDVIVTEQGLVDTRPLTPRQAAEAIIMNCAHPDYREQLWDYYQRAVREVGGHEPHLLKEAFFLHLRLMERGDMRSAKA